MPPNDPAEPPDAAGPSAERPSSEPSTGVGPARGGAADAGPVVPEGFDPKMPYRRLATGDPGPERGGCAAIVLIVVLIVASGSVVFSLIGVLGMSIGFGKLFTLVPGSGRGPLVEWPEPAAPGRPPVEAEPDAPEPIDPAPTGGD
jgi:hypothetical protein